MLLVLWIDQLAAELLEAGQCAFLVRTHQLAIAGNVGGEDRGELAFGLIWGHWGRLPPVPYLHTITECDALGIHSMVRRKIGCYVRPRGSNTEALARRSMKGQGTSRSGTTPQSGALTTTRTGNRED
jgi:hypothetical protein